MTDATLEAQERCRMVVQWWMKMVAQWWMKMVAQWWIKMVALACTELKHPLVLFKYSVAADGSAIIAHSLPLALRVRGGCCDHCNAMLWTWNNVSLTATRC